MPSVIEFLIILIAGESAHRTARLFWHVDRLLSVLLTAGAFLSIYIGLMWMVASLNVVLGHQ